MNERDSIQDWVGENGELLWATPCRGEYDMIIQVYREDTGRPRGHVFSSSKEYFGAFVLKKNPPEEVFDILSYEQPLPTPIKQNIIKWSHEVNQITNDTNYNSLLYAWEFTHE